MMLLFFLLFGQVLSDTVCNNTSNGKYPSTICPTGWSCCHVGASANGYGCIKSNSEFCCLPGVLYPGSTTLPNVMIMGDSVSLGYTPYVINDTKNVYIQHSPSGGDGGAQSTLYGLQCLPLFMKSVNQTFINWDLIQFNFGLHDLDNSTGAENEYKQQLENITQYLMNYDNGSIKLQYATTTPMMVDYDVGNYVVEDDNKHAVDIMNKYDIPIVDLWQRVVDYCGPVPYVNCSICASAPCTQHYNSVGYQWIAVTVSTNITKNLRL
eukprot:441892_1